VTRTRQGHNVTTGIVNRLGAAIVTGTYGEHNPLPIEADLCVQLGASRSVLREAVKMLTAKGLVFSRPRHGTQVQPEERWNLLDPDVLRWLLERKFSLELLAQFTEVRLAIEPTAAMIAAQRASAQDLAPARVAIERMRAAARGDDDPLESDIAFHVALLRATRNRFYIQLDGFINTALRTSIQLTNRVKGVALADVEAHSAILAAIERHDAEGAAHAMKSILQEVLDLIAKARAAIPAAKPPGTGVRRKKSQRAS
jgi:DNA-binding FadR family transcriptional regulator